MCYQKMWSQIGPHVISIIVKSHDPEGCTQRWEVQHKRMCSSLPLLPNDVFLAFLASGWLPAWALIHRLASWHLSRRPLRLMRGTIMASEEYTQRMSDRWVNLPWILKRSGRELGSKEITFLALKRVRDFFASDTHAMLHRMSGAKQEAVPSCPPEPRTHPGCPGPRRRLLPQPPGLELIQHCEMR